MAQAEDIAVIKNDIEYIRVFIEEDRRKFDKHIQESAIYRHKVDSLEKERISLQEFKETEFKDHVLSDRWMFGLSFTILLGILAIVIKIAVNGA